MAWLSRILAPVAFSARCRGATQYAETLSCHFHAELILLHLVAPPPALYRSEEHTGCCRSGPACSISSCARTSSAGTRSFDRTPILFAWRRSTRNGPLSRAYVTKTSIEQ